MKTKSIGEIVALALGISAAPFATAHAHFTLLAPDSWVVEDNLGGPQKGSPCGPMGFDEPAGGTQYSMKVTTVHAGDTIKVDIQETIYHPGYFRVALASNQSDFMDPPLTDMNQCSVDLDSVGTAAHGNVLVDGIAKTDEATGSNRHLMQDVKLPDTPCDDCTLQVMQVMKDHGPPNCFYYHCAKLKILPADGSNTAGSGATAGSSASTAGSSASAGASGSTSAAGGAGGAVASSDAGKGGATAGSSSTTTATAGKSGSTSGTTTSGQTGAAGQRGDLSHDTVSSAGSTAAPSGGTAGAASTTPAAAPASSSGGCSVTHVSSTSNGLLAFAMGAFIAGAFGRRLERRRSRRRLDR
jgi:hypothetical protein